jgi:glutaredoxin
MRSSIRLLQACRITLFTRVNCSLCTDAKDVLSTVWDARRFAYREVDVMKPDQNEWRNLYEFDTPVVGAISLPES